MRLLVFINKEAVSYTHLDVYKRQYVHYEICIYCYLCLSVQRVKQFDNAFQSAIYASINRYASAARYYPRMSSHTVA